MEDETLQCVPQLSMESPLQNAKTKTTGKKRPRMKITAQRKRMEKSSHKKQHKHPNSFAQESPISENVSIGS